MAERAKRRRRAAPLRGHWALSLASFACLVTSAMALGPLLQGTGWWWGMALTAALVFTAMAVLRQLRMSRRIVVAGGALTLLPVLTASFTSNSAILGFLPSFESLGQFARLSDQGWTSIVVQAVPANVGDGLQFLLVCGAGLLAIALDVCVHIGRIPAFAALPLLAVVTIPGLLIDDGAELATLVLVGISYVILLRVDVRVRRVGAARDGGPVWGATVLGVGAVCAALILAGLNPALSDSDFTAARPSGALFGTGVNAMTNLGQDLRRPQATAALRYSSTADEPLYLGMLVLDFFNGENWVPSGLPIDSGNTVDEVSAPPGLSAAIESEEISTEVEVVGVRSNWLPIPAAATRISGLEGDWFWEESTRAVASFTAYTSGQDYAVSSLQLAPTVEQLQNAGGEHPEELDPLLNLPTDRPAIIDETVAQVTSGLDNPWEIAVALQEYFRDGDFEYSEEAPVDEGYDGDGLEVTAEFLERKAGYCVHFASSMTMMARIAGIPSRIVIGYQPGTRTTKLLHGRTAFDVSSDDLHAWPELYFAGVGWVPFEPTPGRGSVPDYSERPVEGTTAPSVAPSSSAASPGASGRPDRPDSGADGGAVATAAAFNAAALRTIGISLGAVLLLLSPFIVRTVRRRARFAAILRGTGIEPAWRELCETAIDLGVPVRDTETPRMMADRLRQQMAHNEGAHNALDRLLEHVEHRRFAAHDPAHAAAKDAVSARAIANDLRSVLTALSAGKRPLERARAALAPASLWAALQGRAAWRAGDA